MRARRRGPRVTSPRLRGLLGRPTEARTDALPTKLFFRIGEVAGLVGVEPHVLRYWEREFRAIRPTKSSKGQRVYSRKDVENLLRVRALLYEEGFTIAGAKKKLSRPGAPELDTETTPEVAAAEEPSADTEACTASLASPEPEPAGVMLADGAVRTSLLGLRAELEELLSSLDEE